MVGWLLALLVNKLKPFVCFTKPEFVWCNIRWSKLALNKALEANNDVFSGVDTFPSVLEFLC